MPGLGDGVLVLNSSWMAVHVASVRRAMALVYQGYAEIVDPDDYAAYDFDDWKDLSEAFEIAECIRTITFKLRVPEVIRLRFFGRMVTKPVRFNRRNIFLRDGNNCQYCGRRFASSELTLDHVVPRSRGGHSTWENIVLACIACNDRKAARIPAEAGMKLIREPKRPNWSHIGFRIGGCRRPSWQKFVDEAYWTTELTD